MKCERCYKQEEVIRLGEWALCLTCAVHLKESYRSNVARLNKAIREYEKAAHVVEPQTS